MFEGPLQSMTVSTFCPGKITKPGSETRNATAPIPTARPISIRQMVIACLQPNSCARTRIVDKQGM